MINEKDLVEYIISSFGNLSNKQLQKIVYLTEIEYMKKHGERLSDLKYVKYKYGPYSSNILDVQKEDENIEISDKKVYNYTAKISELKKDVKINISQNLKEELDNIIENFRGKNARDLEIMAKNTEVFIDAEELGEELDMDGYAEYYKLLLSDKFWSDVNEIDEKNKENNVYGKIVIKNKSDLKSIFS